MLVTGIGLVGHWKSAIGHFFIAKLSLKVQLILESIHELHAVRLQVVALVMDRLS